MFGELLSTAASFVAPVAQIGKGVLDLKTASKQRQLIEEQAKNAALTNSIIRTQAAEQPVTRLDIPFPLGTSDEFVARGPVDPGPTIVVHQPKSSGMTQYLPLALIGAAVLIMTRS